MAISTRKRRLDPWQAIDLFFEGRDAVHQALARLVERLEAAPTLIQLKLAAPYYNDGLVGDRRYLNVARGHTAGGSFR